MTTAILVVLAFAVGYLLGEWRTLKQHEHEMMHTNQELRFWKDIADRQRLALRGPLDPPTISPTLKARADQGPHQESVGIKWKDQPS